MLQARNWKSFLHVVRTLLCCSKIADRRPYLLKSFPNYEGEKRTNIQSLMPGTVALFFSKSIPRSMKPLLTMRSRWPNFSTFRLMTSPALRNASTACSCVTSVKLRSFICKTKEWNYWQVTLCYRAKNSTSYQYSMAGWAME